MCAERIRWRRRRICCRKIWLSTNGFRKIAHLSKRGFGRAQAQESITDFAKDLRDGTLQLRRFEEPFFERARRLSLQATGKLGARTADLLHVAAALELGADILNSFDQQQRKLAQAVRLKVN